MVERNRKAKLGALAALGVALHWTYLAIGLPGGRVLSDALFVAAPLFGAWACARTARRAEGRGRTTWLLLTGTQLCWAVANGWWAYYELILHRTVPNPGPTDVFFTAALVLAVAGVVVGILPVLGSRTSAVRLAFDLVLMGGSLLFIAWAAVLGDIVQHHREIPQTLTWIYPAADVVAATVAFTAMTRLSARLRLPWLLIGGAFLVGATADTLWAWANVNGGFVAGTMVDPLWVLEYTVMGFAALAVRPDTNHRATRVLPTWVETVAPYVPVSVAVVVAVVQQVRHELESPVLLGGLVLMAVLVVRQVLAVSENHGHVRNLEDRVAERTSELQAREEHFRSIVQHLSDVVVILERDGRVRYLSPTVEQALGYTPEEVRDRPLLDFLHPDDREGAVRATRAAVAEPGGRHNCVARGLRKDGTWHHMEATITSLLDRPEVEGIVLALRDISERLALEDRLRYDAQHDSLTGLANRSLFQADLDALLAAGDQPSLVLLDLDEFKAVNDTAGHDLGDEVLIAVAARLLTSTRPGDLVSRLGGDEFGIVLPNDPGGVAAMTVAERMLDSLRSPLRVRGRTVRCLGSVGVVAAEPGSSAAALLSDADVAMYAAKARGKGRIERFSSAMRDAVQRRQDLEDLLRRAIPENRLVLLYQPVVDLATGGFVGAEALLRLRGDDGELVSPVEFIPVAEETGLIVEVGAWVLHEASRQAARWKSLRPDGLPFHIAVNVSTRQLQTVGLHREVAEAIELADLPADLLTLEITEGAIAAGDGDVDATLRSLRALGVRLSIDDFGAGYSSLGRLRHLRVDELKIDRSFIGEVGEGGGEAPLVDAILAMAGRLGLSVVAEGIETSGQAGYLARRSCDRAQGFLYARPLPADELELLLLADLGATSVSR